jgi:hypothetical protein
MDERTFRDRLREAANRARDFARTLVEERLPDTVGFRIRLNSSYDGNPLVGDERVYPEDGSPERAFALRECPEDQVVSTLWREGAVPEWVNLSAIGETEDATLVEVVACGRFTAEEARLYHRAERRAPFHVLGPAMPAGHVDGQRFSIHARAECWSLRDCERLLRNQQKAWSLELRGEEIDADALAPLTNLSALEILEIRGPFLDRRALRWLAQIPGLRVLRIAFPPTHPVDLGNLPVLERLEVLDLEGLPSRSWGFDALAARVPALRELSLKSAGDLILDGRWPPATESITLIAQHVLGAPAGRRRLESFALHVPRASSAEIEALLTTFEAVRSLGLRGTPTTEEQALRLAERFQPAHFDLAYTGLDELAVRRIAAAHPRMRVMPRLKPLTKPPDLR